MKILAIIVTYYPHKALLWENIEAIINNVEKIIIWENPPAEESLKFRFPPNIKIEYASNNINSISKALNFGWKYAREKGYDSLLTMDQDSVWGSFSAFLEKVTSLYGDNKIYAPTIVPGKYENNESFVVDWTITSGMLVPISVLNLVGGYCELFNIDGIDMDFCLKAKEHNISVVIIRKGILHQRYGIPMVRYIMGKRITCSNYMPFRLYEIIYSHIIIFFVHKMSIKSRIWIVRQCVVEIPMKILLFEDNKIKKLKAICSGYKRAFLVIVKKQYKR